MAKFDYKKWVTENKYSKLNEQASPSWLYTYEGCPDYLQISNMSGPGAVYDLPRRETAGGPLAQLGQIIFSSVQGCRKVIDTGTGNPTSTGFTQGIYNSCGECAYYNQASISQSSWFSGTTTTPTGSATGSDTTTTTTGSATSSGCFYCDPYAYAQTQQLTLDPNSNPYIFNPADPGGGDGSYGYCSPSTISGISDPQNLFVNSEIFGQTSVFSYLAAPNSSLYNFLDGQCAASASLITPTGGPTPAGTGSFDDYGIGGGTQFNYPNNWSATGWTNNFVDMMLAHPNPCNFLNQRYNQFGNQLQQGGMGPLQTNLVYQKFAVVHTLLELTGCGLPSSNPFTSLLQEQINEIKLDPAAKQILQKREKEIRGLSRKKRTKKESKKINALKRIIKETLSELQEKQKACSCRNGVCKTAGGNLCPSHECGGACKGSESGRDRKDELYNIGPDKDYCVVDGDGIEGPLPNCPSGCPCGAGCVCMDGKTRYPKGIVGAKDGSMGKLKRVQGKIVYYRSKRSM